MLDIKLLAQKRNRLRIGAAYAFVLLTASCVIGFSDSFTERIAPRPDYYRAVMSEVGRGHFSSTGTTTIVREDDNTLELFLQEYKRRNARLGLPVPASVTIPDRALVQFSFEPNNVELPGISLDDLRAQPHHPTIGINQPSPPLVALLVYSRPEGVIAFFCYEDADETIVNNPPPGLAPTKGLHDALETIDTKGLVSAHGSFPRGKVLPVHAYLFPFGDLKLENLDRHLDLAPDLSVFDYALPLFFRRVSDDAGVTAPRFNQRDTIERLRAEAASGFHNVQVSARFLIPVLSLISLLLITLRFMALRDDYLQEMKLQARVPSAEPKWTSLLRVGFFSFLSGDLEERLEAAVAEARTVYYEKMERQHEEIETAHLRLELEQYRQQGRLSAEHVTQIDRTLRNGGLDELRKLAGELDQIAEQRRRAREEEALRVREQQREIQRLELELSVIPPDKRAGDAAVAWALYQQARDCEDLKEKLNLLKEARKKLPREMRPDRF